MSAGGRGGKTGTGVMGREGAPVTGVTRWALRHKRLVVGFWLVLTILGMAFAKKATDALSQEYSLPGHQSYETNSLITSQYGGGGDSSPLVAVVTVPAGATVNSPAVTAALAQVTARIEQAVPGSRVASFATTSDPAFLSASSRTTFVVDYPPPEPGSFGQSPRAENAVQAALRGVTVAGAPVRVTGYDVLQSQGGGKSVLAEGMIGALGALIVLAFVFASFLAVVPLMIALASIMTTFLAVWGLATATSVSIVVQYLIALVGLGIAIDYTLLIVVRWREERSRGLRGDAAIVAAMNTAGRAVVFSGTAVAVGLLCLVVMPVPFLRSLGYGGMLIPLISVAVTVTLLPVILATIGPRLDWPHRRTDQRASRAWTAWAGLVVRHRWVAAAAAVIVLGVLAGAATTLTLGPADGNPDTLSQGGPAKTALTALERSGIGSGALTPIEIVAPRGDAPGLAHALNDLPGVQGATAPQAAAWHRGNTAIVDVFTHDNSAAALASVRATAHAYGPGIGVGGIDAQNRDFISAVYGSFPLMIALIAVLGFALLARAFRSLLLPAKAIVLNILSIAAAWGALTLIWQKGYGSNALWGIPAIGSIPSWLPVIVFAFLFGLTMDYEVFILSRMREEYDATGSTDTAIVRGIGRTGRLVTSAALILFLAFVAMSTAPITLIKVMATGLGVGILLDATVIRALLVPAAVSLFGAWNWRFPAAAARLLRVSPPAPPPPPPPAADTTPQLDLAGG
jgi:putative drug exporter of the RND superfamily